MDNNKKTIAEVIANIETEKENIEIMSTGFFKLDEWLDGGFLRKELIVVGAPSGLGKSYVASQLVYNISRNGFKCAYFSLEISNEMIVSRMIGSVANIKPTRLRMGLVSPEELVRKEKAIAELRLLGDNVAFYDNLYLIDEIVAEIKNNKYDFIVIDFLQNIFGKGDDQQSRLTNISITLQKTAKEIDGTILAISQLSNTVVREGSSSKLVEYRGSGSIAIVCDLGFFVEREDAEWDPYADNKLALDLRKNRRGGSGMKFPLWFRQPGGFIYEAE